MLIKIGICDDNARELDLLRQKVVLWAENNSHTAEVHVFPSAEAFLFEFDRNTDFDLLLLDIEMGGMDGVSLARQLRSRKSDVEIIFVTTHTEFYGDGYEVDALHFLIKPVDNKKLFDSLFRAAERLCTTEPPIIISSGGETLRLQKRDILYAEAFLHYVSVHTAEREYRIKESISDFHERLGGGFYRCHRSYTVSLGAIRRITRNSVELENGIQLPLSRGKYDDINLAYIRHYS